MFRHLNKKLKKNHNSATILDKIHDIKCIFSCLLAKELSLNTAFENNNWSVHFKIIQEECIYFCALQL